jgi:hypothetical protein
MKAFYNTNSNIIQLTSTVQLMHTENQKGLSNTILILKRMNDEMNDKLHRQLEISRTAAKIYQQDQVKVHHKIKRLKNISKNSSDTICLIKNETSLIPNIMTSCQIMASLIQKVYDKSLNWDKTLLPSINQSKQEIMNFLLQMNKNNFTLFNQIFPDIIKFLKDIQDLNRIIISNSNRSNTNEEIGRAHV